MAPVLLGLALPGTAQAQGDRSLETLVTTSSDYGIANFYRQRGYRPLWLRGGRVSPDARAVLAIVGRAQDDGLGVDPDVVARAVDAVAGADAGRPAELARAELMISGAWVDYVQALARPADIGMTYIDASLAPSAAFPAVILAAAASAPSLNEHLEAVARVNPIYAGLRESLARWRAQQGRSPHIMVPAGPPLSSGSSGPRVSVLRERLGLRGSDAFDAPTAATLVAFKRAHDLPATPVADARTIGFLNGDDDGVERRMRINLDRARLLPGDGRGKFVVVDAASARLWMFEDGRVRGTMKVVVGKLTEQTPMAAGLIRSMVLNPYWNVPPDLVQNRIAPRVLDGGVAYLRSSRFEVLSDWGDDAHVVDPAGIDWAAVAAGRLSPRVRQLPGAGNAMGAMKFLFPNSFGVYLHDTPDKALFAKSDRTLSSGCVRLEDAARLAAWLFGTAPVAAPGSAEQVVPLAKPVPVYLTYLTAAWERSSPVLAADVYGRDPASPPVRTVAQVDPVGTVAGS